MAGERRTFDRVQFGRGYGARIMAIDGTWQRDCRIGDVSDSGAKLQIKGSIDGLDLREFFLVLSNSGSAYRRCERVWLNGDELGLEKGAGCQPVGRAGHAALAIRPGRTDGANFTVPALKLSCSRRPHCL
jgi:hypothetical protein